MDQKILEYIKKARMTGMGDENIRQELLNVGWPQAEVANVFDYLNQNNLQIDQPGESNKINIRQMITGGVIGIILGYSLGYLLGLIIAFAVDTMFLYDLYYSSYSEAVKNVGFPLKIVSGIILCGYLGYVGLKSKIKEGQTFELQKESIINVVSIYLPILKAIGISIIVFLAISSLAIGCIVFLAWLDGLQYPG